MVSSLQIFRLQNCIPRITLQVPQKCATYVFWIFRPSFDLPINKVEAIQPHWSLYLLIIEYSPQYHYHARGFEIRKNGVQLVATYLPTCLSIWYSFGPSSNRLTFISQIPSLFLYKSEHYNNILQ
jgi:hypothetical protein